MNVFIAGPRQVLNLEDPIQERLHNIYEQGFTVLVGDAKGIDTSIQRYFYNLKYENIKVFASQGKARNNIGNWAVENVLVADNYKGFDYYAQKDKAMATEANFGFMIWNGKSKGTLNNIINLTKYKKQTLIYFIPKKEFLTIKNEENLINLVKSCDEETIKLYKKLSKSKQNKKNIEISFKF